MQAVAGRQLALLENPHVGPGSAGGGEAAREAAVTEPDGELVTGHAWLSDRQHGGADGPDLAHGDGA